MASIYRIAAALPPATDRQSAASPQPSPQPQIGNPQHRRSPLSKLPYPLLIFFGTWLSFLYLQAKFNQKQKMYFSVFKLIPETKWGK